MWNVNTLDVIMVVLRVGEQVQTVAWPIIFYLGQAKLLSGPIIGSINICWEDTTIHTYICYNHYSVMMFVLINYLYLFNLHYYKIALLFHFSFI